MKNYLNVMNMIDLITKNKIYAMRKIFNRCLKVSKYLTICLVSLAAYVYFHNLMKLFSK